jgi:hypothetical protein
MKDVYLGSCKQSHSDGVKNGQALLEWLEVEAFRHLVETKVGVVDLGLLLLGEFPGLVAPQPHQPLHPSSHK